MDQLITLAGIVLIAIAVFDIFETLLDPEDQGRLTNAVCWSVWRVFRQGPDLLLSYAGPIAYVSVLGTWALGLIVGWALIYWPQLPDNFAFDAGLDPEKQTGFLTALYLSLVTLATLGYGDISPTAGWLRLLGPAQSLLGFFLLSAAITWILAIYQDIETRRSLAYETTLLQQAMEDADISIGDLDPDSIERLVDELTSRIVKVTGSLSQFPITYFFRVSDDRQSLAVMSLLLLDMSEELKHEQLPTEVRLHARMLTGSLDHLGEVLSDRFVSVESGAGTREILLAYARDHRREFLNGDSDLDSS